MGDWWIYVSFSVGHGGRATIHNGECPYCRHGKGIHPSSSDLRGRWYGPYASKHSAEALANELVKTHIMHCSKCAYLSEK